MPARSAAAAPVAVDAQRLVSAVADIFKAVGIAAEDAQVVAADSGCRRPRRHRIPRGDADAHVCRAHRQGLGVGAQRRRGGQRPRRRDRHRCRPCARATDRAPGGQAGRGAGARDRDRRGGRARRLSLRHGRALRPHDRRAQLRRHRAVEHPPVDAGARRCRGHGRQQSHCRLRCPRPASFRWKRTWR